MINCEKRPPETPSETEGAAPASANAIGTAANQNSASTSHRITNWRGLNQDVVLTRALDGCWLGNFGAMRPTQQDLNAAFSGLLPNGEPLPPVVNKWEDVAAVPQDIWLAPDQAWSVIAENVVAMVDVTRASRRDVAALFGFACHGFATGPRLYIQKRVVDDGSRGECTVEEAVWKSDARWQGYAGRVNGVSAAGSHPIIDGDRPAVVQPDLDSPHGYTKDMKIKRAPVAAWAYLYARFDAAYYEAIGLNQAFIDGNLCEYQQDCCTTANAPYRQLTPREQMGQLRCWGKHLGERMFKRYLDYLRNLLPDVQSEEAMGPDECPVFNGVLDRRTLKVRPYNPADYRLAKYAGVRFELDADGSIVEPEEPRIKREGKTDWTPSEWFHDCMPDENGRLALLAVVILMLFSAIALEKAIMFYGLGRNGKGTFLAMLRGLVGPRDFQNRYISHVMLDKMNNEYYVSRLQGKLANLVDEVNSNQLLKDFANGKAVISGDPVEGRDPYGKVREFVARMVFVFCLNTELKTAEQTSATIDRFVFITFPTAYASRHGGIDTRIKNDYMQRPEVCTWFAYQALTRVPYFASTAEVFDENPYVRQSNAENLAEANPTLRAWSLLRDEVKTSEDGENRWAVVRAMPVYVAHELMSAAKERYEGDTGKLPRQNGRIFRQNLERAAIPDGFRIVRNDDGTAKQLPMREWWDGDAMAPLVDALGDEGLKGWLKDHADARPRAWPVRDYAGPESSPAARAADEAEAAGANFALEFTDYAFSDRALATGNERHDADLRREYGELVGETVAASLAPGGYEVWAAPWRAQPYRPRHASTFGFRPPKIVRFSGLATHDDRGATSPRDWLRGSPWRVPVVKRRVAEGATPLEATRVLLDAVDIMRNHTARVCVSVPRGVVALPGFDAFRALAKAMKACDAGQNADIDTWMVRPVTRRALPPAGGAS